MITTRRLVPLLGLGAVALTLLYLHPTTTRSSLTTLAPTIGMGERVDDTGKIQLSNAESFPAVDNDYAALPSRPSFTAGTPKPIGSNYTKALIMARTTEEDVSWIDEEQLPVNQVIYVVDDPHAQFKTPQNKGHEVMVYLTFLIDFYDNLPDVSIFMHAHRWSWHNNEILNSDAVEMIRRLSSERVQREGYMNLRCHWMPGCPDWMHPGVVDGTRDKAEESEMAQCWSELFPDQPVPELLASACCAQFAISRERIRQIPLQKFVFYRDWLVKTHLPDYISGRIWEYLWHVVFTGHVSFCPSQHACYCDGYGVCFEGEKKFDEWFEVQYRWREARKELAAWEEKAAAVEEQRIHGHINEDAELDVPAVGQDEALRASMDRLAQELDARRDVALGRGADPHIRALESGRDWHEGDGF